jgi:hypothetical protein
MVTPGRRLAVAAWAVAMGLGSLAFEVTVLRARVAPHDLRIFLLASQRLTQGHPLYQMGFVSPPEWALVLAPLSMIPFWGAAVLFISASAGTLLWSSWRAARWLGLPPLPTGLAAVASPMGWWGLMLGQPDALLTALLLELILALGTRRWRLAGIITPWLLLKPDVTWPVVVCVPLALWSERAVRRSYFQAWLPSFALFVLLGGWLIPSWGLALARFGQHSHFQPVLSGLPALVGGELSAATPRQILTSPAGLAAAIAGLLVMIWIATRGGRQLPTSSRAVWMATVPLAIWVTVSPYIHNYDVLFVMPLALLLLNRGPSWSAAALGLALLPLVVFPTLGALAAISSGIVAAAGATALLAPQRDQPAGPETASLEAHPS